MPRTARVAIATLVVAFALAGCAVTPDEPTATLTPGPLPDGVTVELVQLRSDVAAGQAQVMVTNGTDAAIEVGAVAVDDPRFDGPAERVLERTSRIQPGTTTGIRVQLPGPDCPGGDGAPTVTLDIDGAEATAPIADADDFVAPLHVRECRAALLAAAADVEFTDFVPSDAGTPADLELTIAPTGDAEAAITAIARTNLLTFEGADDDLYALDVDVAAGDAEPIVLHLPLVPFRCDPHAVQEDKRGTVFDLVVEVPGDDGHIELAASEDMRGRILTWVTRWCGYGS
jgi:hypothetical protein